MRKMILAGVLAAGALAVVAGTASTNSNTIPDAAVGYGTSHISGATASSIEYIRNTDLSTIQSVRLVFNGDLTGRDIDAGFGSAMSPCGPGTWTGTVNDDPTSGTTTVLCDGFAQDVQTADNFNVAVNGAAVPAAAP
jgi:hypothetical protein